VQLGNVVNIGLALAFTFFLLSLIASGIQECVAGVFKWRGTYLAKALDVILNNDPGATFKFYGLTDWLVAHFTPWASMTFSAHKAKNPTSAGAAPPTAAQIAANARLALLMEEMRSHPLMRDVPSSLPSYISGKTFAQALLAALRDGSQAPLIAQASATISALPDGDLKTTLTTFMLDSGADIDKFRKNIESWFDSAMDRLSGIYKRAAQYALLIIGLPLTIILNVNALHLAYTLWTMDPSALAALADAAAQAKAPGDALTLADANASLTRLQNLALPIGWPHAPGWHALLTLTYWRAHLQHFLAHHLAGWLVTTAAVSLGAPFWFELIQKLVPLRSAGPRPPSDSTQTAN